MSRPNDRARSYSVQALYDEALTLKTPKNAFKTLAISFLVDFSYVIVTNFLRFQED